MIDLLESAPTFVDEFVHIKVHVPTDLSNTHGILKPTYEGSAEHPHTRHKHVHHYHRRRKPSKKPLHIDTGPLLENIILSGLDRPHAGLTQPAEESLKEQPKINTYTVIEETLKKPLVTGYDYNGDHVETYRIVESKGEHDAAYYQKPHQSHVETVKFVEHDDHHYPNSGYKKQPHKETINIVKEHQHSSSPEEFKQNVRYYYKENSDISPVTQPEVYLDYENPEEEIIRIRKPHPDHHIKYTKLYKDYDTESYKYDQPIRESIQSIKSQNPHKYLHSLEYEKSKLHYDEDIAEVEYREHPQLKEEYKEYLEVETPKYNYLSNDKEYESYIPSSGKPTQYDDYIHSSKKSVEYIQTSKKPTDHWKSSIEDAEQVELSEKPKIHKDPKEEYRKPFREYGNKQIASNEYHYKSPANDAKETPYLSYDHNDDTGYQYGKTVSKSRNTYEYPRTQDHKLDREKYVDKTRSSYHYREPSMAAYTSNTDNYEPPLPSTENPPDFHRSPIHHGIVQPVSLQSSSKLKINANIDWPDGLGKDYTSETYTGYDSYSAGHVQGVDSGADRYQSSVHL